MKQNTLLDKSSTPNGAETPTNQLYELFQDWANIFGVDDDN